MTGSDAAFTGSLPQTYDSYLGPLLFEPYAADIAERVRESGAHRVLELAAGTGIVTRALAAALPRARIDATDLNEAMVAFAARSQPNEAIRWSVADAMALPFDDGVFDLVVCQFGVMFFPDRVRAFSEARRMLTPSGQYVFNVWSDLDHNDVARTVSDAAAGVFPDDPPLFLRRTPYGHGDPATLERELRQAGFTHVRCDAVERRSHAASARDAVRGYCEGTPLNHEIIARDPSRLTDVIDIATRALEATFGQGDIDAAMRAFVFTARAG